MHVLIAESGMSSHMAYTTFRVKKEISRKTIQRSALSVSRFEWHRIWEKMALFGGKFPVPTVWKSTPEQQQDCNKVTEYLQGKFRSNSRDEQCAGPWLVFTGHRSTLDSALRERRRKSLQIRNM